MIPTIKVNTKEILWNKAYVLKKVTYEYEGSGRIVEREVYDRGNGAAILLCDITKKKLILTKQFRLPTFLNGNTDGMLIEVCAGVVENETPEACIKRESIEETGYEVFRVQKVFEAYMSPGSVTELIHFFIGEYKQEIKKEQGGGLESEHENIIVLEMDFNQAINLMQQGKIKDAKTIMLLQYAIINGIFKV